ncbi:MAG TPA: DUF3558 family protein [Candidatus Aquilonibacter sp.]|nr:DUF3558 family protein [Candidatus Aquilonibacter sp.]
MMIRSALAFAAAVVFTTLAAAQSPCTLLTPDQIKAVVGESVVPGQPGGPKDSPDCTWRDAKGENRVYLSLKSRDNFNVTRAQMQHSGHLANVSGVGEDAFFVTSAAGSTAYLYTIGKHHLLLLSINIPNGSKQDNEAAEKAVATEVLPKI